jgi:phasin family protein
MAKNGSGTRNYVRKASPAPAKPRAVPVAEAVGSLPAADIAAVTLPPVAEAAAVPAVEPVVATAAQVAEQVEETVAPKIEQLTETVMTETSNFTETAKSNAYAGADKAAAVFTDLSERGKAAFEKGSKVAEELTDITKGNVEAIVASSRAAAKGAETLLQSAGDYSRRSFEQASSAVKTLTAAKTPVEFFQLQNDFAKSHFDQFVAEASKFSENFVKLTGDVVQPLSSRFAVAADKIKAASSI